MNNELILHLNIFGQRVKVSSDDGAIAHRLQHDFDAFLQEKASIADFSLNIFKASIPTTKFKNLVSVRQSENTLSYESGDFLFNDYFGEALTIFDRQTDVAELYSLDINLLHEISYLLILSRTGKKMDLHGWHKIHAMGVASRGRAYVALGGMGVGKSTLFLDLLKRNEIFEAISDDTPIVNGLGKIYTFPLRVGIKNIIETEFKESDALLFERKKYGKKFLLRHSLFNFKKGGSYTKVTLLFLQRKSFEECEIKEAPLLFSIKELIKHFVVGIGLPMVIEYFLERRLSDYPKLFWILIRRIVSAICLLFRSERKLVYIGSNRSMNTAIISKFMLEQK